MEETEKDAVNIPWEVYDYIGIAGCTKYEERYRQTNAELEEYGCRTATWRIDFPSPFKDAMYRIIKKARGQMRSHALASAERFFGGSFISSSFSFILLIRF